MSTSLNTSITPQFQTIDGLRIRYADSGGPKGPVVLLTSPWPESLYAFAPMRATLAEYARLFREVGADIIGACCGSTPPHLRAMAEAIAEGVAQTS